MQVVGVNSVMMQLKGKYHGSVQVTESMNNTVSTADPPKPNDLVHCCGSLSLCEPSEEWGVLGTQGRECDADLNSTRSCGFLCCNKGYFSVTERQEVKVCKFVYCCRVECRVVGYKNVTRHFCR